MFVLSFFLSLSESLKHELLTFFFQKEKSIYGRIFKKHIFLTTTRSVFTKISFPTEVSSEKLMLWRPVSRGSTVKVTKWLEEPSILWGTHLENLLPWESMPGLPDEQIPSTGCILTQNWNTTSEQWFQNTWWSGKLALTMFVWTQILPGTCQIIPHILRR